MTMQPRVIFASCSVAIIIVINVTAVILGPIALRPLQVVSGLIAASVAVQSVRWNPAGLAPALYFSLPPVIALLAGESPAWLIGPLGASLLVASELNALSWECRGSGPIDGLARRRLLNIGQLGGLGLVASLAIPAVASGPSPGGTAAVVVAAIALAGLARVTFGRATSSHSR